MSTLRQSLTLFGRFTGTSQSLMSRVRASRGSIARFSDEPGKPVYEGQEWLGPLTNRMVDDPNLRTYVTPETSTHPSREGESLETKRRRLAYMTGHNGIKEMDVLLGTWAKKHLDTMTPEELDQLDALMTEYDADALKWLSGLEPVPERHNTPLFTRMMEHVASNPTGYKVQNVKNLEH
eukprot:TRINITY_DN1914_c0_g1_i3.p1 TRINITY_DN1914_c0_g1~~TRINITY_DN1914_c0_g1_i3.p1  ORF type:complete len:179 (+),score=26.93 TRINITY_DN1914_c0_g1_i3:259-795(+)